MTDRLIQIHQRLQIDQARLDEIIRQFGDESTMSHFSDRFGRTHPMCRLADEGVSLQQSLHRRRERIRGFCESYEQEFS